MGAKLRKVKPRPLKGSCIRNILANNPQVAEQIETKIAEPIVLRSEAEYDSLHPEEELRKMVAFFKMAKERYESNQQLMAQYQQETNDLWHYAEMHKDLSAKDGFTFYKKTRDSCRKRRVCKNEIEILQPLIDYLSNHQEILNDLPQVQGACGKAKQKIGLRQYTLRTDVMS